MDVSRMFSFITQRLRTEHRTTDMRPDVLPAVPASLEHLLSSNNPPSDVEIPLLHKIHALLSAQLTRLDDETNSLLSSPHSDKTRALEQLGDHAIVLQNRSRQVLGALSTIRRFPVEVLQEIFLKLIPDAGFMVLDPKQGAWAASRVCSSWRSASRHPHLWTTFRITFGECSCSGGGGLGHRCSSFVRYKNPMAILKTALRNSGSCNLDFHVEIQFNDCVGNRSRIYRLLDVLMSHSERWACVSLTIPSELGKYLEGIRGKVPELRCLTFVGCDPKASWEALGEAHVSFAFDMAPKLRQVSITNMRLSLNYSLLTSLTLDFNAYFPLPIPALFAIAKSQQLVYLRANLLDATDDLEDVDMESATISNSSLTHLTIDDPALLTCLSLPALLSLDIEDLGNLSCLPFIPPFLDTSRCSLTRLYFRDSALFGEPLADILKLVPCLTDLGIGFHTNSDAMAHQFWRIEPVLAELIKSLLELVDGEQHRLVPKLESLDFMSRIYWADRDWRFIGPDLVNMLRSRKRTMRRAWFRSTASRLVRFPNLSHACIVTLHELKDEGLDIVIGASDEGGSVL